MRARLTVAPTLPAVQIGRSVVLTSKVFSGLANYAANWPGEVRVLMEAAEEPTANLDNDSFPIADLPFELIVCSFNSAAAEAALTDTQIALLGSDYRQHGFAAACRRADIPHVIVTENPLATRLQIARYEEPSLQRLIRRSLWEFRQERRIKRAIAGATGIQCNGTPSFDAYGHLNRNALLFFDTRASERDVVKPSEFEGRFESRRRSGRLTLVFSGRLSAIKGVEHLPTVACELRTRGCNFNLHVFGDGPSSQALREQVERHGLGDSFVLHGAVDFNRDLIPFLRSKADLFVCCHPQADPSCTYLETMGCGVPIAGYSNSAFSGIVRRSGAGWVTPLNNPKALADRIVALSALEIEEHSRRSADFALKHTFEAEFWHRLEHLRACLRLDPSEVDPPRTSATVRSV